MLDPFQLQYKMPNFAILPYRLSANLNLDNFASNILQTATMLPRLRGSASQIATQTRLFSQTPITPAKNLPPRLKINDADLTISYLKGTGPGGQKIVRSHIQPNEPLQADPSPKQTTPKPTLTSPEQNQLSLPNQPQTQRGSNKMPSDAVPSPEREDCAVIVSGSG
jgi:hypothetical protein